jgi:hypothetical protein
MELESVRPRRRVVPARHAPGALFAVVGNVFASTDPQMVSRHANPASAAVVMTRLDPAPGGGLNRATTPLVSQTTQSRR